MRVVMALFLMSLLLSACDVPSKGASEKEALAPLDSATLVRGNGDEPATLDPQKMTGEPEKNVALDLFEGLVTLSPEGEAIPGVARQWESQDNISYLFHLRQEAKWSDGTLLTAHDFVYAWQRAVDPATGSGYAWYIAAAGVLNAQEIIDGKKAVQALGIKALDDHTLQVTLDSPKVFFPVMLALPTMFPAPRHVIEKYGEKWTQPGHMVSNGAYQLSEWTVNDRVVLTRNTHYWNNAHTHINTVVFLPLKSTSTELKRYFANEVHMTFTIPLDDFKRLQKAYSREIKISPIVASYYYSLNSLRKPLDDVRVRKALSYAIDREKLTHVVLGQGQIPAYGLIPHITRGYTAQLPTWATSSQAERVRQAQRLLKEAGYDAAHPLDISLLYNTDENHKKVAVAIASMWQQALGCRVKLVNQEWKTYLETRKLKQFDIVRAGWNADYNEAISMLDVLRSTSPLNESGYSDKEFDALLETVSRTFDAKTRQQLYYRAERKVDEMMPIIPLYQYVKVHMLKPYVKGYKSNALDFIYSKDLSFATEGK